MTDIGQAAKTPMSDHVARFWQHLRTEHVRIGVDLRREISCGTYWDGATFPNDVAKAIAAQRDDLVKALADCVRSYELQDADNFTVQMRTACERAARLLGCVGTVGGRS